MSTTQRQRYVKAINNHNTNEYGYLPFKKGNLIAIYPKKEIQPGYMWGVLNDKQGIFPASCVEDYDVSFFFIYRSGVLICQCFLVFNHITEFFF